MMSYDSFVRSVWSHHARISLTQLVFALESYRRDKGKYPDALDELQQGYLAEIPLDPFLDKPFRYVVEPANVLLYSVGVNGIDDEGRDWDDEPQGDDIRRRLPTK
jgi:hypothetical protein